MNRDLLIKVLEEKIPSDWISSINLELDHRTAGPVTPNAEVSVFWLRYGTESYRHLALTVLSWKVGVLGFLIREKVISEIKKHGSEEREIGVLLSLVSETDCLEFLEYNFSERDFFGNLLPLVEKLVKSIRVRTIRPKRAERKLRRRGYRDPGSLRPSQVRVIPPEVLFYPEEIEKLETKQELFRSFFPTIQHLLL